MSQQQQQQLQQLEEQKKKVENRLLELQREQAELQQQLAVQAFAGSYEIAVQWPATITFTGNHRTNRDLIQHRLLEAGLVYEVPIPTADVVAAASALIQNLEATDCFHAVKVEIGSGGTDTGGSSLDGSDSIPLRKINVRLHEKNWYRLHAGAGLKTNGWLTGGGGSSADTAVSTDSFLPTAEVEISAGLRNIAGCLDRTDIQYAVNTHNIGTWNLTHTRPLYTVLPAAVADTVLEQPTGSQYSFSARAALDTTDHVSVSSYQQFQRLISVKAATSETKRNPAAANNNNNTPWYASIEWGVVHRDLIPRRHATLPYHFAASSEIVAAAGASVKHSVTAVLHYDSTGTATTRRRTTSESSTSVTLPDDQSKLPVSGVQLQCSTELGAPPGDVGFVKGQAAVAAHVPLTDRFALHASFATGYLHPLEFGGLCCANRPASAVLVSDRFLLGGTGSFRGFGPAGIGPRVTTTTTTTAATVGGTKKTMGDALGGNFFYTATAMASLAPATTIEALSVVTSHVRLFGFATAGTCLGSGGGGGISGVHDVIGSTRVSAGIGVATQVMGPRVEATYAWPLRYGPNDGRRRFQFGASFSV